MKDQLKEYTKNINEIAEKMKELNRIKRNAIISVKDQMENSCLKRISRVQKSIHELETALRILYSAYYGKEYDLLTEHELNNPFLLAEWTEDTLKAFHNKDEEQKFNKFTIAADISINTQLIKGLKRRLVDYEKELVDLKNI